MARLVTEWSTDDPRLAETLRSIQNATGSVRLEMEAALHTMQARQCIIDAEHQREYERRYGGRKRLGPPNDR